MLSFYYQKEINFYFIDMVFIILGKRKGRKDYEGTVFLFKKKKPARSHWFYYYWVKNVEIRQSAPYSTTFDIENIKC